MGAFPESPCLGDWVVVVSNPPEGSRENWSEHDSEMIFGEASETILLSKDSFIAPDYVEVGSRQALLDALSQFAPEFQSCSGE